MTAQEIGKRINFFREKLHLTKNALANNSGVSPTYINDLEKGKKCPTVEILSYICDALGVTLSTFFAEDINNKKLTIDNLSTRQKDLFNDFLNSLNN